MAYADFDIEKVQDTFGTTMQALPLFPSVAMETPPRWLVEHYTRIQGMSVNTEKVRSEVYVSPLLIALRELDENQLGVYSGIRFDVESATGLVGECDFIISERDSINVVQAPVVMLVEAKKADIDSGLGQCMAQMIAAQKFNEKKQQTIPVYGCVTTGFDWQFMKLESKTFAYDNRVRHITELPLLLGIFRHMIAEARAAWAK